uniref:Uncharacterized protein n=1 Tax=Anguilla anguilla TaxID=7936 RepID=A0A0E9WH25_ANGAN
MPDPLTAAQTVTQSLSILRVYGFCVPLCLYLHSQHISQ